MGTITDNVNHPQHYATSSGLEAIQVIQAFTEDLTGIEAVDTANVIKYILRWNKKNGLEDLYKAKWYLEHLINYIELGCNGGIETSDFSHYMNPPTED